MKVIEKKNKLCLCCMETHEVKLVDVEETTIFKGIPVKHIARYEYCDVADEFLSGDDLIASNDIAMKNAYRKAANLLTTDEIVAIREKYGVSQKDLASILGWGEKTITRYEGHQVQDAAHDFVLRKINDDPICFFEFIERRKDTLTEDLYRKYKSAIEQQREQMQDHYLRKAIASEYLKYQEDPNACGARHLDLDKVIAVINYFANSSDVISLYKVKLMKLLWYADFLSYKRYGKSITGLVYTSMPMGAVPIGHKSIINLRGVYYDEVEFEHGSGMKFKSNKEASFDALEEREIDVLDSVITYFGKLSKSQLVNCMHEEEAYQKTSEGAIISYAYAEWLSVE